MKTKTTEELLTKLAHIRKQIAEYDQRAEIATRKIEETPYADEIRFVYAEIDRLDKHADVIEQRVRMRVTQDLSRSNRCEIYPGVTRKITVTRDITIAKDLSMYLEEKEDVTCT